MESLNEEIVNWLSSRGITVSHINDMWMEYWDSISIPDGHFNDRMYSWLGDLGYTGSISKRWYDWLTNAIYAGLPPDFQDDPTDPSTLLVYLDGSNASATTKTDKINGYNFTAVEGPCLTLATGDTIAMKAHGTFSSNGGTATCTYDGNDLTVTAGGTLFNLQFSDNTVWPCSEGKGTAGTNLTITDTTGEHSGTVTAAAGASTAWGSTQDSYFDAMYRGWYEDETAADGIYYPADPGTDLINNLQFTISGGGSLTISGTEYTAGTHVLTDLTNPALEITADKKTETDIAWTGDTVSGSYPDYTINMSSSKVVTATFSTPVTYTLTLTISGSSKITINSTDYTSTGSPHTITGLSGSTSMTAGYTAPDDTTTWSGTDAGDVTGTDPNFAIDMDANKSLTATFSTATSYLVDEDFEGTGTPTGWSTTGTVDFDFDSTSPVLSGTKSLKIDNSTATGYVTTPTFTAQDEFWMYFKMQKSADADLRSMKFNELNSMRVNGNTTFMFKHGDVYINTSSSYSTGTTYHFWIKYVKSTGSDDGVLEAYISTTGTKPASPTCSISTGTQTDDISTIDLGSHSGTGAVLSFDDIIVSETSIGDQ